MIPAEQLPGGFVPEHGVRGRVSRAVKHPPLARGELERLSLGQRTGHMRGRTPRAKARGYRPQRMDDVLGYPVAQHDRGGERVVVLHLALVVGKPRREAIERAHLGARALREDLHEADVVDVLVGDDDSLEVLDTMPMSLEGVLERRERSGRVGPRVQQRQRLVLDQVAVDAPHRERRWDRQAVHTPRARMRSRNRAHDPVGAAERISSSTSSRRRSMSSCERSDSRHRRSSGSVLDGRTLKCQSS